MYKKIPPGPGSTHGLPRWESVRPESSLEKAHEFIAHYANTGTSTELADVLTLGGIAAHNLKRRFRRTIHNLRMGGEEIQIPMEFMETPPFPDHSYLHWLDSQAEALQLPQYFKFATPVGEDNGELFLSEYFLQQQQQNEQKETHPGTSLCICESCLKYFSNKPQHAAIQEAQETKHTVATTATTKSTKMSKKILQPLQATTTKQCNKTLTFLNPSLPMPPRTPPTGLLLPPVGHCFPVAPFFCSHRLEYYKRIFAGEQTSWLPSLLSNAAVNLVVN